MVQFQALLAYLWHSLEGGVVIFGLGDNLFIFQFFYYVDFIKVIQGVPWIFNNHFLVFGRLFSGRIRFKFGCLL